VGRKEQAVNSGGSNTSLAFAKTHLNVASFLGGKITFKVKKILMIYFID